MESLRSAVLLIRVWLEDGPDDFRARLLISGGSAGDEGEDFTTVATASSPSQVTDAVGNWLDRFLADARE